MDTFLQLYSQHINTNWLIAFGGIALMAVLYFAFRVYTNRQYKKFYRIGLKRLGGAPVSEKEGNFFRKNSEMARRRTFKRTNVYRNFSKRVSTFMHYPRKALASIYTEYNPLKLKDDVKALTMRCNILLRTIESLNAEYAALLSTIEVPKEKDKKPSVNHKTTPLNSLGKPKYRTVQTGLESEFA